MSSDFDFFNEFDTFKNKEEQTIVKETCDCNIPIDDWLQEDGFQVCPSCGFQIYCSLDMNAEYRFYGNEDSKAVDPTRCGMPIDPLLPNSSLSTMMAGKNNQLKRLQSWSSIPYKERSLKQVFDIITNVCNELKLNQSVIQLSKSIYHSIREHQLSRGRNRNALLSACIYNACKACGVKILPDTIYKHFGLQFCDLCEGHKTLAELLVHSKHKIEIKPSEWNDFLERFCIELKFTNEETKDIMNLANKINELSILKKHIPQSFASGVLYYFIQQKNMKHISKDHVLQICDISKVTIEKIYAKILPWTCIIFD